MRFLLILLFAGVANAGQLNNQYKTEQAINNEMTNIFLSMQEKMKVLRTTPTIDQMTELQPVLVSTGTLSTWILVEGNTYYMTWTRR